MRHRLSFLLAALRAKQVRCAWRALMVAQRAPCASGSAGQVSAMLHDMAAGGTASGCQGNTREKADGPLRPMALRAKSMWCALTVTDGSVNQAGVALPGTALCN